MTIGQVIFTTVNGLPFVEPNVNIGVPNGKVAFFASGTGFTAPISVYKDAGLTQLWTQPIQANAAGILPPIYLNPLIPYANNAMAVQVLLADGVTVKRQLDPISIPYLITSGSQAIQIANPMVGEVTMGPATAGLTLSVTAPQNGAGLSLIGGNDSRLFGSGPDIPLMIVNNAGTVGTQTASFVASNVPGANSVGPRRWIPIQCDGTLYYAVLFGH